MAFWEFVGKNAGVGLIATGAVVGVASAAQGVVGNPVSGVLTGGAGLGVAATCISVGAGLEIIGGL